MAITRAQAWKTNTSGSSTVTCAYTSNVTAGNTLVAVLTWFGTGNLTVTSFSDTLTQTWTARATSKNVSQDKVCIIYVAENIGSGGADTITAVISGSPADPTLTIVELTGTNTASFDQTTQATGGATVPDYGSLTPSQDNEMLIAGCTGIGSTPTADTGYTLRIDGTPGTHQFAVFDEIQTTATTRATFMTAPSAGSGWAAAGITLKAAAAAGTTWGQQTSDQWCRIVQGN